MLVVGWLLLAQTQSGVADTGAIQLEDVDLRTEGLHFAFAPDALIGPQEAATAAPSDPAGVAPPADGGVAEPFGTKGTWRINAYAEAAFALKRGGEAYMLGGGWSYFIARDFSMEMELLGMYVDQNGGDAVGGNVNLLLRWHFYNTETWSIYADAGAGLLLTTENVPSKGSSFNFTPQVGMGFSFEVSRDVRMLAGIRWHHISNANLYDENPGRDNVLIYAGLSFPY